VQRAIEMQGVPTVFVTAEPEETAQARSPRALAPRGLAPGQSMGSTPELQRRVLLEALSLLAGPPRPGEVVFLDL